MVVVVVGRCSVGVLGSELREFRKESGCIHLARHLSLIVLLN